MDVNIENRNLRTQVANLSSEIVALRETRDQFRVEGQKLVKINVDQADEIAALKATIKRMESENA